MALKANTFDAALCKLFDALADVELLCRTTHTQIGNAASLADQALEQGRSENVAAGQPATASIGTSVAFTIPDLLRPSLRRIFFGDTHRQDGEMLKLIEEIDHRLQAQCIGLAYEAFEAFLREFAATLFFHTRGTWTLTSAKPFHKRNPKFGKANAKNTDIYFAAYVDYLAKHNCDELLKEVRDMLPDAVKTGENNWFGDVFALFRLVGVVRHLTVHRGGEVGPRSLDKLGPRERQDVTTVIRPSAVSGKRTLLPTVKMTAHLVEGLTALAYVLYRAASTKLRMKPLV